MNNNDDVMNVKNVYGGKKGMIWLGGLVMLWSDCVTYVYVYVYVT